LAALSGRDRGLAVMVTLRINNEDDRVTVAGILVKNGYRVEQGKESLPGKRSKYYVLFAEYIRDKQGDDQNI
jgi:hypothetical protein